MALEQLTIYETTAESQILMFSRYRHSDHDHEGCCKQSISIQSEALRFEKAIVSTASNGGKPGIVTLPGAKSIIEEVLRVEFLFVLLLTMFRAARPTSLLPETSMGDLYICDPGVCDIRSHYDWDTDP